MTPWPAALEDRSLVALLAVVEVPLLPAHTAPKEEPKAGTGLLGQFTQEVGLEITAALFSLPSLGLLMLPVRTDGPQVREGVSMAVARWRQEGSPDMGYGAVGVIGEDGKVKTDATQFAPA